MTFAIDSDNDLNPELAEQVQGVRGMINSTAEQQPLPARFSVEHSTTNPTVTITDTLNGRSTEVGLFAYRSVREALYELFGTESLTQEIVIQRLIRAHNNVAFGLRNDSDRAGALACIALAMDELNQITSIIPKDFKQTGEDTGRERAFGAIEDAQACFVDVANSEDRWISPYTQACCELWSAAMNYAKGCGIDPTMEVQPKLDRMA